MYETSASNASGSMKNVPAANIDGRSPLKLHKRDEAQEESRLLNKSSPTDSTLKEAVDENIVSNENVEEFTSQKKRSVAVTISQKKTKMAPISPLQTCISCGVRQFGCWYRSWDPYRMLCSGCGPLWKKYNIHCKCGYVITERQLETAFIDDQGNSVFICQKCKEHVVLEKFKISANSLPASEPSKVNFSAGVLGSLMKHCLSCQAKKSSVWHRIWNNSQGELCNTCMSRYEQTGKRYCKICYFVPYPSETNMPVVYEEGNQSFSCYKCYLNAISCLSCETKQTDRWLPSWDPKKKLCFACGSRFKRSNQYCKHCKFVPYTRLTSKAMNKYNVTRCKCIPYDADKHNACISCRRTGIDRWQSSWNNDEGRLCTRCAARYATHGSHCLNCGFVPLHEEFQEMMNGNQQGRITNCPQCTSHSPPCTSCRTILSHHWHESLNSGNGRMCNWCFERYKDTRLFCMECGLVPSPSDLKNLSLDTGSEPKMCPRLGCPSSLTQDHQNFNSPEMRCISCNKKSSTWRESWDDSLGMLCNPCGRRYEAHHLYCGNEECHFVPLQSHIDKAKLGPLGSKIVICSKCHSSIRIEV